jgi:flagellar hook-associated protein 3 FlgL
MARITFNTMYSTVMRNFQKNQAHLNTLQEQASTGKRINRPSDDPIGFSQAMGYRNQLAAIAQRKTNMDDGKLYLTALDRTHDKFTTIYQRSSELAVQASNDTYNYQQRLDTHAEIRQELEEMVSLANSKVGEDYIFSGTFTKEKPYELKNGNALFDTTALTTLPPSGVYSPVTISLFDNSSQDKNVGPGAVNTEKQPLVARIVPGSLVIPGLQEKLPGVDEADADYEVDYVNGTITALNENAAVAIAGMNGTSTTMGSGDITFQYVYRNSNDLSGDITREVDTGVTMKINTNPDDLFGKDDGQDSFSAMIGLLEGLWENKTNMIGEGIDNLDTASARNLSQQAVEGARYNRMDLVYGRNAELKVDITDAQSKVESVDVADALSEFALADAVYTSSLQAASKLLTTNLMNYI